MSREPIACPSCKGVHWTQRELWACETFGPVQMFNRAKVQAVDPITPRQLNYIERLDGDTVHAAKLNKREASDYIDRLLSEKSQYVSRIAQSVKDVQAMPKAQRPVDGWRLSTPRAMIEATHDGRYAVRADENEPFKFIRIYRPKTGSKRGQILLQTQHSDYYKTCVAIWPNGHVAIYDMRIDSSLLLVVVDPVTAARRYGQELGRCCACGRELTDGRSIHYGIGPECEKSWPQIISSVDDENNGQPYRA